MFDPPAKALIVDNDLAHAETVAESLGRVGFVCRVADSGKAGAAAIEDDQFDVVITDLVMNDLDGLEILARAKADQPDAEVILMTGHGTVPSAVEAMREIRDRAPRLVVVQVSLLSAEPVRLIRMLRHTTQPVLIVAVANSHRNQLEQVVRDAGASCYLPSIEDEDQLVQAVASMLDYVPSHVATGTTMVPLVRLDPPPRLLRRGKKGAHR